MAAIESTANFGHRARELGITDEALTALGVAGMDTFGAYAFLVPYSGTATDEAPLREALVRITGGEVFPEQMSRFRRLQFAHTAVMTDAKSRIEQTQTTEPKKIPVSERAARHRAQAARLSGVTINEHIEPSHQLLDLVEAMVEEGVLQHIGVDRCTSRFQEIHGIKKEPSVRVDASSGTIKLASKPHDIEADVSSEYKLRQAFTRRSLAFDQAGLVLFVHMEKWHDHLMEALYREPPPGYSYVTRSQILSADREMFLRMSEDCRKGLKPDSAGMRPVEEALRAYMFNPSVQFMLLPLPGASGKGAKRKHNDMTAGGDASTSEGKGSGKDKKKNRRKSSGKSDKGKGKGSKGNKGNFEKGLWSHIGGKPLCPNFQKGKCFDAVPGETCAKGLHSCAVPKCGHEHPK
jgi:hypothetical protein